MYSVNFVILYLFIILATSDYSSKQGRSIILTINEKKRKYKLLQSKSFVLNTDTICKTEKNQNEKIIFKFVCGFEFQKPQVIDDKTSCVTNVLNIDPEICEIKVCIFSCKLNYKLYLLF